MNRQGYIEAARIQGYSTTRILLRHFLPNVSSETIAYALSDFILVIMLISGLSFLTLGAAPPTAEWGVMMSEGRPFVQQAWWMTIFPGLALCWAGHLALVHRRRPLAPRARRMTGRIASGSGRPLVDIRDLKIGIGRGRGEPLVVVDNATFKVGRGEMLGLIGESGSGKTMVCRSLIGTLHRRGARILSGSICLGGLDLALVTRTSGATSAAAASATCRRARSPASTR